MILCDTDVLIELFRQHEKTVVEMERIGYGNVEVSAVTVMELFVGARNKKELNKIKKDLQAVRVQHIEPMISQKAVELIEQYTKSHGLKSHDAFIAATALIHSVELFTYNVKDFRFIAGLQPYRPLE